MAFARRRSHRPQVVRWGDIRPITATSTPVSRKAAARASVSLALDLGKRSSPPQSDRPCSTSSRASVSTSCTHAIILSSDGDDNNDDNDDDDDSNGYSNGFTKPKANKKGTANRSTGREEKRAMEAAATTNDAVPKRALWLAIDEHSLPDTCRVLGGDAMHGEASGPPLIARVERDIGSGGFGWVCQAVCVGGQRHAVKMVRRPWSPDCFVGVTRELLVHGLFAQHPHVVRLHRATLASRVFWTESTMRNAAPLRPPREPIATWPARPAMELPTLVMEPMLGSAHEIVSASRSTCRASQREALAHTMLLHVLRALASMHALGIAHRDVKPENILYTVDAGRASATARCNGDRAAKTSAGNRLAPALRAGALRFKLADMGLARFVGFGVPTSTTDDATKHDDKNWNNDHDNHDHNDDHKDNGDWDRDACSAMGPALTSGVCTHAYKAPELALAYSHERRSHYGPAVDVWALGIAAAEVLVGHRIPAARRHGESGIGNAQAPCGAGVWPPFDVSAVCAAAVAGSREPRRGEVTVARVLCDIAETVDFAPALARYRSPPTLSPRETSDELSMSPVGAAIVHAVGAHALAQRGCNMTEWLRRRGAAMCSPSSARLADLLTRMLDPDPTRRITASRALAHPLFAAAVSPRRAYLPMTIVPRSPSATPIACAKDIQRGENATGDSDTLRSAVCGCAPEAQDVCKVRAAVLAVVRDVCRCHNLGLASFAACVDLFDARLRALPVTRGVGLYDECRAVAAAALAIAAALWAPAGRSTIDRIARHAFGPGAASQGATSSHVGRPGGNQLVNHAACLLAAIGLTVPRPDRGTVGALRKRHALSRSTCQPPTPSPPLQAMRVADAQPVANAHTETKGASTPQNGRHGGVATAGTRKRPRTTTPTATPMARHRDNKRPRWDAGAHHYSDDPEWEWIWCIVLSTCQSS